MVIKFLLHGELLSVCNYYSSIIVILFLYFWMPDVRMSPIYTTLCSVYITMLILMKIIQEFRINYKCTLTFTFCLTIVTSLCLFIKVINSKRRSVSIEITVYTNKCTNLHHMELIKYNNLLSLIIKIFFKYKKKLIVREY